MPAPTPNDADGVLLLQDDDPADLGAPTAHDSTPWRILIVDDDVDVHVVTKFALSNINFQGRRLSFLHAYSGAEAIAVLRSTPDIAMVLLDVIMETPEAGLHVARQIRSELHNELVRIVLRTGQPGQAFEHSIIIDYDINDFWCKADLTTRKLFTTVIASLRAYATLAAVAAERACLAAALAEAQQFKQLVEREVLVVMLDRAGRIVEVNDAACRLSGVEPGDLLGRDLHNLPPGQYLEPHASAVTAALASEGAWSGEIGVISASGHAIVLRCAALVMNDAAGNRPGEPAIGEPPAIR